MTGVFIRLSVFWQNRQLDVSLPASRPIVDVINDIITLLGAGESDDPHPQNDVVGTPVWLLSSPKTGILENEATLSDYDILDGHKLYLTKRNEAAHSPFVDDVMAEVRNSISENQWRWSGESRRRGMFIIASTLSALLYLISLWQVGIAPDKLNHWSPIQWLFGGIVLTITTIFVILSVWQPQPVLRWFSIALPISAVGFSYPFLHGFPAAIELGSLITIGTLMSIAVPLITSRNTKRSGVAGSLAFLGVAIAALIVVVCNAYGVSALALIAWSSWLPIAILLIAPGIAVRSSGLASLLRRNDAGDPIARLDIRSHAARATAYCDALVWFATGIGILISLTLISSPYWQQGLCGVIVAIILIFRSNGFSDARLIAPLIFSGSFCLTVATGSLTYWIEHRHADPVHIPWWTQFGEGALVPWLVFGISLIILVLVFLALQSYTPHEVQEARSASIISTFDTMFSVTAIPVILIAQGVVTYLWATR